MSLQSKMDDGTCVVGVVGLGYVGLPLSRAFCEAGLRVVGFDIDASKVEMLRAGNNYLQHLGDDFLRPLSGRFEATTDFARLGEPDAVILCVPTPLDARLQPDLSFVERTSDAVAATLRPGQLIVLESTTYPGTTREVVLQRLERSGLVCGKDFFVAYSPEREDPGRLDHSTRTIPKLVGGLDEESGLLATALYGKAIDRVVRVRTAEIAEAAKLLENIYRAVNIALVNEMKVVLGAMGIDVWDVIAAAATKPFGFQAFFPGPGLGGHCIPIDPFYLTARAREIGLSTRFIELAGEINRAMPEVVVRRVVAALNEVSKAVRGSKVLVLGLAYKPNVDDCRESPSLELIDLLIAQGASVDYSDPHVPETPRTRRGHRALKSVSIEARALAGYDCVLVATHHDAFDWKLIAEHARVIVDTRNALAGHKTKGRLIKA